jgi:Acetyltransferase (GNAT) family.
MILLKRAGLAECNRIHEMQVIAFQELLDKYQDYETNPAMETVDLVRGRIDQDHMDYYLIFAGDADIGAIRVVRLPDEVCRIAPVFILPGYQGRGYAKEVFCQIEQMYPQVKKWKLETIKEEPKLCGLYEAVGYRLTGREEIVKPGMTLVYYEKHL